LRMPGARSDLQAATGLPGERELENLLHFGGIDDVSAPAPLVGAGGVGGRVDGEDCRMRLWFLVAEDGAAPLLDSPPRRPAPGRAQARPGWGRKRARAVLACA